MTTKSRRDEIKRQAKALLRDGIAPRDGYSESVERAATKLAKRSNRLSLVRQSRRATRAERSLRRRATEWQQDERKRLAEALVNA